MTIQKQWNGLKFLLARLRDAFVRSNKRSIKQNFKGGDGTMKCTDCDDEYRCDWDQSNCPRQREEKQEAKWAEFIRRRFEKVN